MREPHGQGQRDRGTDSRGCAPGSEPPPPTTPRRPTTPSSSASRPSSTAWPLVSTTTPRLGRLRRRFSTAIQLGLTRAAFPGEPRDERFETGLIASGEPRDEARESPIDHGLHLGRELAARRGDRDLNAAPVVRRRLTAHQSTLLGPIDQPGHARFVDAEKGWPARSIPGRRSRSTPSRRSCGIERSFAFAASDSTDCTAKDNCTSPSTSSGRAEEGVVDHLRLLSNW